MQVHALQPSAALFLVLRRLSRMLTLTLTHTSPSSASAGLSPSHQALRPQPVALTVAFSSVAGALGSVGQGNYAFANASMDAACGLWQQRGVLATAVQWGPWAAVGMAAREGAALERALARLGFRGLRPREGLDTLDLVLRHVPGSKGSLMPSLMATRTDWDTLARAQAPTALYRDLLGSDQDSVAQRQRECGLDTTIAQVVDITDAVPATDLLELPRVLRVVLDAIADATGQVSRATDPLLGSSGLDSLAAVELR